MNPNVHPTIYPEAANLPPEYAFMSGDTIDELRDLQFQRENSDRAAAWQAPDKISATQAVESNLLIRIDPESEAYVSAHMNREDNPELFDAFKQMVMDASHYGLTAESWKLGVRNLDGSYDLETSGKNRHEVKLAELFPVNHPCPPSPVIEPLTEVVEIPPSLEEFDDAHAELDSSRAQLAAVSVQRRRMLRKGGKNAKNLEAEFDAAQKEYENSRLALGTLKAREWRQDGSNDTSLRSKVATFILDEHQNFSKAEMAHLQEDPSRRARLARYMACHNKTFFAATGAVSFGIGYGLGKVTKGTVAAGLGLVGAATLPAVIFGGVAVKTTNAILQSSLHNRKNQLRSHDKRSAEDLEQLGKETRVRINREQTADGMLLAANGLLSGRINERVDKDVKSNRKRVIGTVAVGGLMGAAGYLVADEFDGILPKFSRELSVPDLGIGLPGTELPPVAPDEAPAAEEKSEWQPHRFDVQSGSGIQQEIHEWGHELVGDDFTDQDAQRVYELAHDRYGDGLVSMPGHQGADLYTVGDDVQISSPGEARFRQQYIENFIREEIEKSAKK